MDINQNNAQINTFGGGMNSDTSLDQINENQYLFGLNIRISNNTVIFEDPTSNNKEGVICPIRSGTIMQLYDSEYNDEINAGFLTYIRILAVDSIKDYGVLILEDNEHHWNVFRIQYKNEYQLITKKLFRSTKLVKGAKRFSIVLNEEIKDMIKLYIANGEDEIMQLFVKYNNEDDLSYISEINKELVNSFKSPITGENFYNKEDLLKSNYIFPLDKTIIAKKIPGRLRTSQIQYAYRFYKKSGIVSKLSPLTNKIQVINDSKHSETGCAEDTVTNIGFLLNIPCNDGYVKLFDRLQIYRLNYVKPNQDAEINLIYDGELIYDTGDVISINDDGNNNLQQLTIEEFSQLNGQDIIPKTIESTQGYMFASNIKDKSSIWLDIKDYNPRAYQFDKNGICTLYRDNDTTYSQTPFKSSTYPTKYDDVKDYTHNEASDVNYKENIEKGCFFTKAGIVGGEGPNISWMFVSMYIDVHQDVDNAKKPDVTKNERNLQERELYYYIYRNGKINGSKYENRTKYLEDKYVYTERSYDYNSVIGSSLCRSLQRDEVYRYGIVFYDERGVRTDVLWIADIRVPSIKYMPNVYYNTESTVNGKILSAIPLGIQFKVKMPKHPEEGHTFVGYEIVRCEKNYLNTHNVLQVALSTPVHQLLPEVDNDTAYSSYYPTGLIATNAIQIYESYKYSSGDLHIAENINNRSLYQIFNPQILYQRNDILQQLQNIDLGISNLMYIYGKELQEDSKNLVWGNFIDRNKNEDVYTFLQADYGGIAIARQALKYQNSYQMRYKLDKTTVFNLYNRTDIQKNATQSDVLDIQDVKNPTWEEGFTNIKFNDQAKVATAVSAYKSFITSIQNETYINWACCGMYDITTGVEDEHGTYYSLQNWLMFINKGDNSSGDVSHARKIFSHGYIGPGPVCFIMKTKNNILVDPIKSTLSSALCNLTHNAVQFAGLTEQEKQYDLYYGFGNFVKFEYNIQKNKVFDGDIYNIPCEFVSLFKTYDFNCLTDALPSTQIVYYIPMESRINTFFDYGMNFKNTTNPNLQLEPGRIDGVSSQTRPLHQINLIYSDNTNSNNMFNPQTSDKGIDQFQQRILYSQLKTNGENIDNWQIFKAIDFIDVDSKYGQITNLLASNDTIFFWQEQAFGKLSVNERSLVTDNNNNTVQLGQAGVLQRSDYLDTKHGMREYDYSAININSGIFWIDVLNKCIAAFSNGQVINYSEYKNVQSIMNTYCIDENTFIGTTDKFELTTHLPTIHYDLQNDELLCDCMFGTISPDKHEGKRMQLVFNTKMNIATSMYTRKYQNILNLNGRLYGICLDKNITFTKYNHLIGNTGDGLLFPTVIHFVVNKSASDTKVFDNQKIVTLKKKYNSKEQKQFFKDKMLFFETDLNSSFKNKTTYDLTQYDYQYYQISDRESNIQYPIPRETFNLSNAPTQPYGKRLRGKWMQVYIRDNKPSIDYTISHIITKFRKSFN